MEANAQAGSETISTVERFKRDARPVFGTVSGPSSSYRIAVRNKTHLKQLQAFAAGYGATAAVHGGGGWPKLATITFAQADAFGPEPAE